MAHRWTVLRRVVTVVYITPSQFSPHNLLTPYCLFKEGNYLQVIYQRYLGRQLVKAVKVSQKLGLYM